MVFGSVARRRGILARMKTSLLLVLLLLVPPSQADRLDAAFRGVREAVEKDEIPGAIALVARGGKVLREEACGTSDLEGRVPFAKNTLCWIASITKPVTTAAAMKLVDAGKLSLDDPVEKHLPEFAAQKDREGRHHAFTIRHLMTHSSGLLRDSPTRKSAMGPDWRSQRIPDIVSAVAKTELQFAPGAKFQYSNAGFVTLGRVIEVVSGKAYADYVKEAILDPLGMKDSHYAIPAAEAKRVSPVYGEKAGKREAYFRFDPDFKVVNTAPNGGLFSYPSELLKFVQLFLENDGRVLSKEAVGEMVKEQAAGRGLGWALKDGGFGHGGSSGTYCWAEPKTGVVGILFLQCTDDKGKSSRVTSAFFRAIQDAFRD
jgi:CubicO group peptidase (beta-lactamase class C family)